MPVTIVTTIHKMIMTMPKLMSLMSLFIIFYIVMPLANVSCVLMFPHRL